MITPNYLDIVLWQFTHVIDAGWEVMRPIAAYLFWTMAGIYLLWSMILVCQKAKHPLEIMLACFFSLMKVYLFDAAMDHLQRLEEILVKVLTDLGLAVGAAGGVPMTSDQFFSPGTILAESWKILTPMQNHWNTLSAIWSAGTFIMHLISLLACMVAFFLISLHVLTAVTTYRLLGLFSFPLLAMGILPATSFIAKSCLDGLIACAVRLGVLALVCSIILPLIQRLALPDGMRPDFWSSLSTAAGANLLAVLSWKAPAYAQELFGGRIATAAGDLIAMVLGAGYGATRLASGGQQVVTQVVHGAQTLAARVAEPMERATLGAFRGRTEA